jgi:hypothetical protein
MTNEEHNRLGAERGKCEEEEREVMRPGLCAIHRQMTFSSISLNTSARLLWNSSVAYSWTAQSLYGDAASLSVKE